MEPPREPFDITDVLSRVREAVRPFPKAAMFELAERGFGSLFHQLVSCVLSIRTYDEVSLPASIALFERAPTAAALASLDEAEIDAVIRAVTFHEAKAGQVRAIARAAVDNGGDLPASYEFLTGLRGVGPKCANLALGIAKGEAVISVDIHVHRVTNRWGYVSAPTPELTLKALKDVLPAQHRIEINALLVPFGKHICTGRLPACSTCPVLGPCAQVGVGAHR